MSIRSIGLRNTIKTVLFILLYLFIILLLFNIKNFEFFTQFLFCPQSNVFEYSISNVEYNKYYKIELFDIYDWYAEDDEGRYYITDAYDGDDLKYMGLYVESDQIDLMEMLCENTWHIMDGDEDNGSVAKGRCYLTDMGEQEKTFFREYFAETDVEEDYLCYKTLVYVPVWKTFRYHGGIFNLIALGFGLFMIPITIWNFFYMYKKPLKYMVEKYGITREMVESDIQNASSIGEAVFGARYLAYIGISLGFAMPYDRIVSARVLSNTYKLTAFKKNEDYAVEIFDESFKSFMIAAHSLKEADLILAEIIKRSVNINPERCGHKDTNFPSLGRISGGHFADSHNFKQS